MKKVLLAATLMVPTLVLADGGSDEPPPKPAVACTGSQIFDTATGKCVDPQKSNLDRDTRYLSVRQLAYSGRYLDAQGVLDTMDPLDPGRLTYMGFTHRKLGNLELANLFYEQAIQTDPANILARSYMGQGFVETGHIQEALVQLRAIREHGGAGTWSETSLRNAIATGKTNNY